METHDRPAFPWWLALLLMFALAAGVGLFTYNLGMVHGIAQSGAIAAAPAPGAVAPGTVPPAYYYYPRHWGWGWGGWGFGFFPFFGLLWFFLIFGIIRRLVWGPRWWWRRRYYGYYGCGPWGYDDYWYRRGPYGPGPQGPQGQPGPPPPTTTQL